MSTDYVDTRVVQIQFDSKKFQKEAKKAEKSLQAIDNSLAFKDSKKGMKDLQKSLDSLNTDKAEKGANGLAEGISKVTIGLKDMIKYKVVSKVIDSITDATISFAKQVSGINYVTAGWQAYENQITTVGGVVNNVLSKYSGDNAQAEALADVTEAMQKLQWYADETSFSFDTMSNGIRQFTTAGLDVSAATEAAMGVTALAGASKEFNGEKVSSAMNAISKSLQQGYLSLTQWNTISQTAGIASQDFTNALLEQAYAAGKIGKTAYGDYFNKKTGKAITAENIASSLSDKIITKEVLSKVLARYSAASTATSKILEDYANTESENYKTLVEIFGEGEDLTASTVIATLENEEYAKTLKEIGYEYDALSLKAFKSSQQATSFSQAVASVGEASKAQFQQMFGYMFGDADQSTELWSELANDLNSIFVGPIYNLTDMFAAWSELDDGGAADFRSALVDIFQFLKEIREVLDEVMVDVFGDTVENGVSLLQRLTKRLKAFTSALKSNEKLKNGIKSVLTFVFKMFKGLGKLMSSLFKVVKASWPLLKMAFNGIIKVIGWIADKISVFADMIEKSGVMAKITNFLAQAWERFYKVLKDVGKWFQSKWKKITESWNNNGVAQKLVKFFTDIYDRFKNNTFKEAVVGTLKDFKDVMITFWNFLKEAFPKLDEWWGKIANSKFMQTLLTFLKAIWSSIKTVAFAIMDTFETFVETFKKDPKEGINAAIKSALRLVALILIIKTVLGLLSVFKNLSWALDSIRAYFNAKKYLAWALIIASIAGSLWIVIDAIANLANLGSKGDAWNAFGMVAAVLGVITGMVVGLLAAVHYWGANDKKIVLALMGMQNMCIGISILLVAVGHMFDKVKGMSWNDMGKVGALLVAIGGIITALVAVSKREKGVKLTNLWSFIKIAGITYVMFVVVKKIYEYAKDLEWKKIGKTASIVGIVIVAFGVVALAMKGLSKIKLGVGEVLNTVGTLAFIGMIIASATAVLYLLTKTDTEGASGAVLKGIGFFAAITALALATAALGRVISMIPLKDYSGVMLGFKGALTSIIITIAGILLSMKLLEKLNIENVWSNLKIVGIIAGALAAFVLLMNVIGIFLKARALTIGSSGVTWQRPGSNPVFLAMLGISISLLAIIGAVKLMESVDQDKFVSSIHKIAAIVGFLTVCITLIGVATRLATGSSQGSVYDFAKFLKSLVVLLIAIVALDYYIKYIGGITRLWRPFVALLVLLTVIVGSVIALGKWAKQSMFSIKQVIAVMVSILLLVGSIITIYEIIQKTDHPGIMAIAFGTVIAVLAALITALWALGKFVKSSNTPGMIKQIIAIVVSVMVLMTGVVAMGKILKDVPAGVIMSGVAGMLIALAGLSLIMLVLNTTLETIKSTNSQFKSFQKLVGSTIRLTLSIALLAIALGVFGRTIKDTPWQSLLAGCVMLAVVFGGIALILKVLSKIKDNDAKKTIKGVTVLITSFVACLILISAFWTDINSVKWSKIGLIAAGFAGVILAIAWAIKITKDCKASSVWGMAALVFMFITTIIVISRFWNEIDSVKWSKVGLIAAGFAGLILVIAVAIKLAGKDALIGAVAIVMIVTIFIAAILLIAGMWDYISAIDVKQLGIITAILAGFILVMAIIAGILGGAVGAMALVGVLVIALVVAILILALWAIAAIMDKYGDAINKFIKGLCDTFVEVVDKIAQVDGKSFAANCGLIALGLGELALGLLALTGQSIIDGIAKLFGGGSGNALDSVISIINAVASMPENAPESLSAIIDFIKNVPDALNSVTINQETIDAFTAGVNTIISKLRELKSEIESMSHFTIQIDVVGLDKFDGLSIKNTSANALNNAMAQTMGGGMVINGGSNTVINITNQNSFTDALTYSYDQMRMTEANAAQIAKSIGK